MWGIREEDLKALIKEAINETDSLLSEYLALQARYEKLVRECAKQREELAQLREYKQLIDGLRKVVIPNGRVAGTSEHRRDMGSTKDPSERVHSS